jgi:hypothetical protein
MGRPRKLGQATANDVARLQIAVANLATDITDLRVEIIKRLDALAGRHAPNPAPAVTVEPERKNY